MSQSNDSIGKTLLVAVALCLVCSVFVSGSAVSLRAKQNENKALDKQRNIVSVAGLDQPGKTTAEIFKAHIEARVVDLDSGRFTDEVDAASYDQRKASKDPAQSRALTKDVDIASIKRRERYATVYLTRNAGGDIDRIILPVRGYGLWSTLWGFLALEGDGNTVIGLSFYEHAETPGLGGEVDNPAWKAQWKGKKVYPAAGADPAMSSATWRPRKGAASIDDTPAIRLAKGGADPNAADAVHKVDSLSGATLTSRGITSLLHYWLGEQGFSPFLKNLREGRAS